MITQLNNDKWDCYFCVNQPKAGFVGVKPSDNDIEYYERFIVDLDPVDANGIVIITPNKLPLAPIFTYAVYTGRGIQLHIPLEKHNHPNDYVSRRVSAFLTKLAGWPVWPGKGCVVDTCTSDASRIVRIPYTKNWKLLNSGCGFMEVNPVLSSEASPLKFGMMPEPLPIPEHTKVSAEFTNLSQVAPRLTRIATKFLLEGVRQNRHSAAYATAACLRDLGIPKKTAMTWVVDYGAAMCIPQLDEKDAIHCVKSAYKDSGS